MTTDLKTQIRGYFDEIDPPFEPHELMVRPAADRISDGVAAKLRWRRLPGWALAAVTAAIVLLVAAGSVWLTGSLGEETPPAITQPPTSTSIPERIDGPIGALTSDRINQVEDLALAPDGTVWAATRGGIVRWDRGAAVPVVYGEEDGLPTGLVDQIVVASDGTAWATGYGWVAYYDQTWQSVDGEDIRNGTMIAGMMVADPTGGVLAATNYGLLRIDRSGTERMDWPEGLVGNSHPSDAAIDAAGRVWVSAIFGDVGLVLYDGSARREFTTDDGLPSNNSSNVAVAPDGTVWVATAGIDADVGGSPAAGVASFDGQAWTTYTTADGLASDEGTVVAALDGTVWVVHGDAVSRREGATWTVHDVAGSPFGAVGGPDGTLWLGTDNGIVQFDGIATTRYVVPEEMTPAIGPFSLEPIAPAAPPFDAGEFGEVVWQTYEVPVGHVVSGAFATAHGFVARGETAMLTTTDGVTWTAVDTPVGPSRFASSGDDLYALGAGAVRLVWTGTTWEAVAELAIPDLGQRYVEQMVFGDGVTVITAGTRVFFSTDGDNFLPARQGPDPELLPGAGEPDPDVSGGPEDPTNESLAGGCRGTLLSGGFGEGSVGPVFSTSRGFVAFTARHPADWNNEPMCRPVIWTSDDGNTWDLASTESPFGPNSHIRDIAEHDGRLVAVGGHGSSAMLWVSDDGLTWNEIPEERISGRMTSNPWSISAGETGWVAIHGNATSARAMYSLDGLNWVVAAEELPDFGWAFGPPEVTIGTDRILVPFVVVSIGEITR